MYTAMGNLPVVKTCIILTILTDDKEGIAPVPAEMFEDRMHKAMAFASAKADE